MNHGGRDAVVRHVGDMGNIIANEDGYAEFEFEEPMVMLYGENSVMGRGCVIHAEADDLGLGGDEGSLATGNAGGRLSCGTIVDDYAQDEEPEEKQPYDPEAPSEKEPVEPAQQDEVMKLPKHHGSRHSWKHN